MEASEVEASLPVGVSALVFAAASDAAPLLCTLASNAALRSMSPRGGPTSHHAGPLSLLPLNYLCRSFCIFHVWA